MVAAFDVENVNPNPARFDLKKAESINGDHIRLLEPHDFAERTVPYLVAAGVFDGGPTDAQREMLDAAAPLVQERVGLLGETPGMLGFLFTSADRLEYADDALSGLPANAADVLAAAAEALDKVAEEEWVTERIQSALAGRLVDGLGLKPRVAYGPVRVAVSGRRVSPPLFESLELLGREESLRRIERLRARTNA
jgi:glutamyl-tRNA synthetase